MRRKDVELKVPTFPPIDVPVFHPIQATVATICYDGSLQSPVQLPTACLSFETALKTAWVPQADQNCLLGIFYPFFLDGFEVDEHRAIFHMRVSKSIPQT